MEQPICKELVRYIPPVSYCPRPSRNYPPLTFFSLPREIRDKIYHHALVSTSHIIVWKGKLITEYLPLYKGTQRIWGGEPTSRLPGEPLATRRHQLAFPLSTSTFCCLARRWTTKPPWFSTIRTHSLSRGIITGILSSVGWRPSVLITEIPLQFWRYVPNDPIKCGKITAGSDSGIISYL